MEFVDLYDGDRNFTGKKIVREKNIRKDYINYLYIFG